MIGDIADRQHQITLIEVSPNEYKFEIDYVPNETKQAQISGTLQGWNGTETKIDANGAVSRETTSNTASKGLQQATGIMVTSFIIGVISSAMLPAFLFGGVILGLNVIRIDNESKDKTIIYFRARDYLLQKLIDVFKSVGDVEAI